MERLPTEIKGGFCLLAFLLGGVSTAGAALSQPTAQRAGLSEREDMVLVPAGKFVFGKGSNKKVLELPAYQIDKHEVTNREFARFNLDYKFEPGTEKMPATMVSQIDATNHCEAVGKRLPTEPEWEKAARGADEREYPWGNDFDAEAAVTGETDFRGHPPQPLEVGSRAKGKSPYGALDMAGNVWEWTASNEGRYFVLKGGSFFEDRGYATTTSRLLSIPNDSKDYVGFRCAKAVQ